MLRHALPLLALLSGCGATGIVDPPVKIAAVTGKVWVLRQLEGQHVNRTDAEAATIRFLADHWIVGTSACNDVGGEELTWSANSSGRTGAFRRNQTGATITTAAGCLDALAMQLGDRFWARMIDARDWSASATTLTIRFSDGSGALLAPVPRTGSYFGGRQVA